MEKIDKETLEMLMNPLPKFIENSLNDYRNQKKKEDKILVIESMRMILPIKLSVYNPAIVKYFDDFIAMMDDGDIYEEMVLLIGEMSDYREKLQNDFVDRNIFEKLNYAFESSYFLIRALCTSNRRNYNIFMERYYDEDRDGKNERIIALKKSVLE